MVIITQLLLLKCLESSSCFLTVRPGSTPAPGAPSGVWIPRDTWQELCFIVRPPSPRRHDLKYVSTKGWTVFFSRRWDKAARHKFGTNWDNFIMVQSALQQQAPGDRVSWKTIIYQKSYLKWNCNWKRQLVGFWKIISAAGLVCYKFLSKKQFPSADSADDLGQEGPCPVSPDGNLMPLQMPASVVMKQWIVLKLSHGKLGVSKTFRTEWTELQRSGCCDD